MLRVEMLALLKRCALKCFAVEMLAQLKRFAVEMLRIYRPAMWLASRGGTRIPPGLINCDRPVGRTARARRVRNQFPICGQPDTAVSCRFSNCLGTPVFSAKTAGTKTVARFTPYAVCIYGGKGPRFRFMGKWLKNRNFALLLTTDKKEKMKNTTIRISLLAVIALMLASCKQKLDMDFINSVMNVQSKLSQSIEAVKSGNASMTAFANTMKQQAEEMSSAKKNPVDASELVSKMTALISQRGDLLNQFTGVSTQLGDLLNKYKARGIKLKEAKSQFDGIQKTISELTAKVGESDGAFSDIQSKFTAMYQAFKGSHK